MFMGLLVFYVMFFIVEIKLDVNFQTDTVCQTFLPEESESPYIHIVFHLVTHSFLSEIIQITVIMRIANTFDIF